MRQPSSRITTQTCQIYKASHSQDRAGGFSPSYSEFPSYVDVPCSAQAYSYMEAYEQGILVIQREWKLMFASPVVVRPKDQIQFMDSAGVVHHVFAEAVRDEAGRGMAYVVRAIEKL